jgi:hypothetical protein
VLHTCSLPLCKGRNVGSFDIKPSFLLIPLSLNSHCACLKLKANRRMGVAAPPSFQTELETVMGVWPAVCF